MPVGGIDGGDAPPLLLYGHVDAVPAEGDWTHPPFDGALEDGYVWGRGALDMKGGVVVFLAAFLRVAAEGIEPAGDPLLVFTALSGLRAFGDVTLSPRGNAAIGLLGLLALLVGFFGLPPRVDESAPGLPLAGIGAVTLSAVGSLVLLGWTAISFASGAFSGDPPA